MLLYHSHKPDLLHEWSLFQGSIPESFGKKIDKVIQHLLKVTTPTNYKKYMVLTNVESFVNFEFIFMKLSGIDPCGNPMIL